MHTTSIHVPFPFFRAATSKVCFFLASNSSLLADLSDDDNEAVHLYQLDKAIMRFQCFKPEMQVNAMGRC